MQEGKVLPSNHPHGWSADILRDYRIDCHSIQSHGPRTVDKLSPEKRSELMRSVRGKDTLPERRVRSLLHSLGYRFRLHRRDLPGTPDIVFPARKRIVFVNGCFWHFHGCRFGRTPASRQDYWIPKLQANRERDNRKTAELEAAGWRALSVWECELRDMDALTIKLIDFLGAPRTAAGPADGACPDQRSSAGTG